MKTILLITLAIAAPGMLAQLSPTTPRATDIRLIQGPEIELAKQHLTIIRWTTNNPGGSPVHYGVVRYGTDPKHLDQLAKNPIRLNPGHPSTVFRVRLDNLRPGTTYYYKVESAEANGEPDGLKSPLGRFTSP